MTVLLVLLSNCTEKEASKKDIPKAIGIADGGGLLLKNETEIEKYFNSLETLGISWLRFDLDQWTVQSEAEIFDWGKIDLIVDAAEKHNIKLIGVLCYAPPWERKEDYDYRENVEYPPGDIEAFASFAGKAADRYKEHIKVWEIWNEPNMQIFWYPQANASEYATILKATSAAIKKINPDAIIIVGGLAPVEKNKKGSIPPADFLEILYKEDAGNYFDAIAVHPYCYPLSPDSSLDQNGWHQLYKVREVMVQNGDKDKKIWITEFGAPTGGKGKVCEINDIPFDWEQGDYMSEEAQLKIFEVALEEWKKEEWLGPIILYTLEDKKEQEHFFGLIKTDNTPKPAYDAIKNEIKIAHKI